MNIFELEVGHYSQEALLNSQLHTFSVTLIQFISEHLGISSIWGLFS